jgi:hypothetical protein
VFLCATARVRCTPTPLGCPNGVRMRTLSAQGRGSDHHAPLFAAAGTPEDTPTTGVSPNLARAGPPKVNVEPYLVVKGGNNPPPRPIWSQICPSLCSRPVPDALLRAREAFAGAYMPPKRATWRPRRSKRARRTPPSAHMEPNWTQVALDGPPQRFI